MRETLILNQERFISKLFEIFQFWCCFRVRIFSALILESLPCRRHAKWKTSSVSAVPKLSFACTKRRRPCRCVSGRRRSIGKVLRLTQFFPARRAILETVDALIPYLRARWAQVPPAFL